MCVSSGGRVIWTHNDSGDSPRLFAFDPKGTSLRIVNVFRAKARDWEDICSFSLGEASYLAIGDVGDNQALRSSVQVYLVELPSDLNQIPEEGLKVAATLDIKYEDGPVNCEALAYDPKKRAIVLLSKETFRCRIYEVPLQRLEGNQFCSASLVQSLLLPMVTGADISPDGTRLAIATYGVGAMLYREEAEGKNGDASLKWGHPQGIAAALFELPIRRQGESICFTRSNLKREPVEGAERAGGKAASDSREPDVVDAGKGNTFESSSRSSNSLQSLRLLLTSEFAPAPLFTVPCPAPPEGMSIGESLEPK